MLLSQNEIINLLQNDGYNISIRDLRYWRYLSYLPSLHISETYEFFYPEEVLNNIRDLAYK
ncbi:MAG: hypothetical protein AABY07_03305, partial [Nanoarchaeota archaeon]